MDSDVVSGRTKKTLERLKIKKFFLLSTIIASVSVVIGTILGSYLISVLLPVSLMLIYIIWTYRTEIDLPLNIVGDSYYYMGFTLTLVALTASLISLSDTDISISKIIASFGAAMSTTIVGLVARLIITTFSIETIDRTFRLQREVENSIDKFKAQLETLTSNTITSLVKTSSEINTSATDTISMLDQLKASTKKEIDNTVQEFEKLATSVSQKVQSIEIDPLIIEKAVSESLRDFRQQFSHLTEEYSQLAIDTQKLSAEVTSSIDRINSQAKEEREHSNARINTIIENNAKNYEAVLSKFEDSLSNQLKSIGNVDTVVQDVSNKIASSYDSIYERQTEAFSKLLTNLEKYNEHSGRWVEAFELIDLSLSKQEQAAARQIDSIEAFKELSTNIKSQYTDFSELFAKLKGIDDTFATKSKNILEQIESLMANIEVINRTASSDITLVYKELTSALRKINDKD